MCEMEHLVDTESISQDDMSALLEICEPLHVTEEKAHLDCRAHASRAPAVRPRLLCRPARDLATSMDYDSTVQ